MFTILCIHTSLKMLFIFLKLDFMFLKLDLRFLKLVFIFFKLDFIFLKLVFIFLNSGLKRCRESYVDYLKRLRDNIKQMRPEMLTKGKEAGSIRSRLLPTTLWWRLKNTWLWVPVRSKPASLAGTSPLRLQPLPIPVKDMTGKRYVTDDDVIFRTKHVKLKSIGKYNKRCLLQDGYAEHLQTCHIFHKISSSYLFVFCVRLKTFQPPLVYQTFWLCSDLWRH